MVLRVRVPCECAQAAWACSHLDEAPLLAEILRLIHSLSPSSAGAERNWSIQDFIFSRRRNRLDGRRGTQLVAIYWNLRALARKLGGQCPDVNAWRARCAEPHAGFPHPTRGWLPFSNWTESADDLQFTGMHGDEYGDEDAGDEDDEDVVDDQPASDWTGAGTRIIRPCPGSTVDEVNLALQRGPCDIVCWFGAPYNEWYVGKVDGVDRRRQLPVLATFEDGPAHLLLDPAVYGVHGQREWALLEPLPDQGGPSNASGMQPRGNARPAQVTVTILDDSESESGS